MSRRHHATSQVDRPLAEHGLVDPGGFDRRLQRRVLKLGEECRLPSVDPQVVGVLDRRCFVDVEPLGPSNAGSRVHSFTVLEVVLVSCGRAGSRPLSFLPQFGVFLPELVIRRPFIDQRRPLTLPSWMSISIEELVGQVAGPDHGERGEAGNRLAGAGEAEDRPSHDVEPRRYLSR